MEDLIQYMYLFYLINLLIFKIYHIRLYFSVKYFLEAKVKILFAFSKKEKSRTKPLYGFVIRTV